MKHFILFVIFITWSQKTIIAEEPEWQYTQPDISADELLQDVNEEWLDQKLDHFNLTNNHTWEMRYLSNLKYFKPQGPIFIVVGGFRYLDPYVISEMLFFHVGSKLNAAFYNIEHRFYGQHFPTPDLSLDNLQYLNSKQVLADLAYFIETKKKNPEMSNSKIVLMGYEDGGNIVTWFTQKHPELIVGGWALSAPLKAVFEFNECDHSVASTIKKVCGKVSYDKLSSSFSELDKLLENDVETFVEKFKICPGFDPTYETDIWFLYDVIRDYIFSYIVTNSYKEIENALCYPIEEHNYSVDVLVHLINSEMKSRNLYCLPASYNEMKFNLNQTDLNDYSKGRALLYEKCTEYGSFLTTKPDTGDTIFPRKIPINYSLHLCHELFGIEPLTVYNNIDETNKRYGGLQTKRDNKKNNMIWTTGEFDPWLALQMKDNIIRGQSSLSELDTINEDDDIDGLRRVKWKITDTIRKWVNGI